MMKFQEIMHESDPTDTNLVAYVKKANLFK